MTGETRLQIGKILKTILGWLAWERFRCNVDCKTFPDTCIGEKLFLEQGERLAKDGNVFTLGKNINTNKAYGNSLTASHLSECFSCVDRSDGWPV